MLWADIDAAYEGDPAANSYEEIILAYPSIEAIAIQRMAHLLYQKELPLIPRMMTEWAHGHTGIDIHPGAKIGSHFFIDHGTGVVIGESCVIGAHVKLYHGVTLGRAELSKRRAGPNQKGRQTSPERGRSRHDLSQLDGARWRDGDRRAQHDRRKCFPDSERAARFARLLRREAD